MLRFASALAGRRTATGRDDMCLPQAGARARQHLGGGALAGADRPVHVAVPVGRGLGAGPMDPADGLTDRVAVGRHQPGRVDADGTATTPALLGPLRGEELGRLHRLGTEQLGKLGEDRVPPGGTIEVGEAARAVAADEPEDDAGPAVLGAVVEGRVDEAVRRQRRAVQPLRAPEGRPVGSRDLRQRPLGEPLGERVAGAGHRRVVVDPAGEDRRDGDDRALGGDDGAVGDDPDAAAALDDPADR